MRPYRQSNIDLPRMLSDVVRELLKSRLARHLQLKILIPLHPSVLDKDNLSLCPGLVPSPACVGKPRTLSQRKTFSEQSLDFPSGDIADVKLRPHLRRRDALTLGMASR